MKYCTCGQEPFDSCNDQNFFEQFCLLVNNSNAYLNQQRQTCVLLAAAYGPRKIPFTIICLSWRIEYDQSFKIKKSSQPFQHTQNIIKYV